MGSVLDHLADSLPGTGSTNDRLHDFFAGAAGLARGGEIVYAENVTNVLTTAPGTTGVAGAWVDVPGVTISVPVTARPVWLLGKCQAQQTVLGLGSALIGILETTGADTLRQQTTGLLPNSTTARGSQISLPPVLLRLGPTLAVRSFKLAIRCDSIAANTPSWVCGNGPAYASFLYAWAD